jgi:hypothetical protein
MDVQSQNSCISPFYDPSPYFLEILACPLVFVKRGCMFFYIRALAPKEDGQSNNQAGRRMTHNTGDSYASVCKLGRSIMKDLQAVDLHDAEQERSKNVERPTPNVEANAQRGEIGRAAWE